jgi:hypothetical protein
MPRQLTFWQDEERPTPPRRTWEDLDERRRDALVIALAKLIGKEAQPVRTDPQAEDNHER